MRHGYTEGLAKRLERHNPSARLICEAVVTTNEDIKDKKADWDAADSTFPNPNPLWFFSSQSDVPNYLNIGGGFFCHSDKNGASQGFPVSRLFQFPVVGLGCEG